MILIVGLGNPGKQYNNTRHNIGFMAIDSLHSAIAPDLSWNKNSTFHGEIIKSESYILLKPLTYMNLSGKSVKAVQMMYKISAENVWVLHDDLDLNLGRIKIQKDAGPAGHNGIKSIIDSLGTNHFFRWRIGIGRPSHGQADPADFVLDKFTENEEDVISQTLSTTVESIQFALKNTVIATMNKYN